VVVRPGFRYYFLTDVPNAYWAIPLRAGDEGRIGFVSPDGQYCYLAMGQCLKTACNTFSRFWQLAFGAIPKESNADGVVKPAMKFAVGDHGSCAFDGLIDDSCGVQKRLRTCAGSSIKSLLSSVCIRPSLFETKQIIFFYPSPEFVGLQAGVSELRPSLQKRDVILNWAPPTCEKEVEAFRYLTPFLRRFIPERAC